MFGALNIFFFYYFTHIDVSDISSFDDISDYQPLNLETELDIWPFDDISDYQTLNLETKLDISSFFDRIDYQTLNLGTDIDEMDLNFISLDFAYENIPGLINKADSGIEQIGNITSFSAESSTNPYLGENTWNKAKRFKRATKTLFEAMHGSPNMYLNHTSSYNHFYWVGLGPDSYQGYYFCEIGIEKPNGTFFYKIMEEPLAQRFQIYASFKPIDLSIPFYEECYTKEYNPLPGLQSPTPNYDNSIDMPNGIPIEFDFNWPVELKNKFLFAQECNRRSISETNVLKSYDLDNTTEMYRNMYREALAKKNAYLFNRDSAIRDLQRTNENIN